MILKHFQRAVDAALSFARNQSGSILIYTGAFMAIGVGGAALSIDIGRIVLLKTQMQNRADAGALAGAAQLDAETGAIERAKAVVEDSMVGYTTAGNVDNNALGVYYTKYYAVDLDDPTRTQRGLETTVDGEARFVEVVMERRTLSFFYGPALNIMTGKSGGNETQLGARAVGMSDPFICKMQPLMMCNPFDDGIPSTDDPSPADEVNWGKGVLIKTAPSGSMWGPGNFGLLQLPGDAGYTESGARAVEAALSAEDPLGCYAVNSITTQTGTPAMNIYDGINVRWDGPKMAPNVMNYPRDNSMIVGDATYDGSPLGQGVWDLAGYWSGNHAGVPMPTKLANATRYQMYLFELGVTYWKAKSKKSTKFVLDGTDAPSNWDEINPLTYYADTATYPGLQTTTAPDTAIPVSAADPTNPDVDGIPDDPGDVSTKGQARRVVTIAVANCQDIDGGFQGASDLPANGVYVELFITEKAAPPSGGVTVYGEIIKAIKARTSIEFHGNVRLVE